MKEGYFDGGFVHHQNGDCDVFSFTATLQASDAVYRNFDIITKRCDTDLILPNPDKVIVRIEVDLLVVSIGQMEQWREMQMEQWREMKMFSQLYGDCPPDELTPQAKRIKQEIDSKVIKGPVTIKPDQNNRTKYIVEKINDFAKRNGLEPYTITFAYGQLKFSKYSTSKTDITVFNRDKSTVLTAGVYYDNEADDEAGEHQDEEDDIAETKVDKGLDEGIYLGNCWPEWTRHWETYSIGQLLRVLCLLN